MANEQVIDNLLINVESNASAASGSIRGIVEDLKALRKVGSFNKATNSLSALADSLEKYNGVQNPENILNGTAAGLARIKDIGSVRSAANALQTIQSTVEKLGAMDPSAVERAATYVTSLADSFRAFDGIKVSGVSTTINSLGKIGEVTDKLNDETLSRFQERISRVSSILQPLNERSTTLAQALSRIKGSSTEASAGMQEMDSSVSHNVITFAALTVGIRNVINKLRSAINSIQAFIADAVEWDGVSERFMRGFGNNAQDAYAWIQRLNQEMGLNTQQFMQYTSIYAQMLEGLGVVTGDAYQMALGYSELTYDIWAGYNDVFKTYEEAAEAIQSAISGNTRSIRRAGFSVLNTTLQQTAANHGLEISISNATEAEKSYLRYLALVDQAHQTGIIGTYAQEMNTAEGTIRTLAQEMKSLGQAAGSLFLPLLQHAIPVLTAVVNMATDAVRRIAALFGVTIQAINWDTSKYTAGVTDYADGVEDVADAYGSAAGAADKYKRTILGIDEINPLNAVNTGSGGGGGGAGSTAGDTGIDWDISKVWTDAVFDKIQQRISDIRAEFEKMAPYIAAIGSGVLLATVSALADKLTEMSVPAKILTSLFTLGVDFGLNFVLSKAFVETDNLAYLLAEALTTAAAGVVMFKIAGPAGLSATLAVSVVAQIMGMSAAIKEGADFNWGQAILTALEGAGAGAALGWAIGLGPAGIAIAAGVGLALTITGIAIATSKAEFERAVKEDLDSRFGTIQYTPEQIELLADHILVGFNDSVATVNGSEITMREALRLYADADLNLNAKSVVVENSAEMFGKLFSSVSIGMDVSEAQMEQYFGEFLSAGQEYLNENQLKAQLAFGVLGLDGSDLSESSNSMYNTYSAQYEELGRQLHEVLADAFVDGEWIPGKMDVAKEIFNEMQEVLNKVSDLQLSAGLEGLGMDIGKDFTADSFVEGMSKAWEQAQEAVSSLMSARNTAIAEAMANGIYEESKDKIESAFNDRKMEIDLEVLSFGIKTLNLNYADAMNTVDWDGMINDISSNIQTRLDTGLSEINIDSLFSGFQGDNPFLIDNKAARESLERMLETLIPTEEDMLRMAEEYKKLGQEIPEGMRAGINDTERLKAMVGDAEAVNYMVGTAIAQGQSYTTMISTIENAFAGVDEAGRRGIANNTKIVYDSATGMALGVMNSITGEIAALTPTVIANLEALGIQIGNKLGWMRSDLAIRSGKVGDDIILGLKDPIDRGGAQIPHLFEEIGNDSIETLRNTVDSHSPAKKFEAIGKDIMSGLANPVKSGSSSYNTLMATFGALGSAIVTKLSKSFEGTSLRSIGETMIKGIAGGMSNVDFPTFHFDWTQAYKEFTLLGKTMKMYIPWPNLSFYANGGIPQTGELFMARESGNEFVGRIGNKSAVANNEQMVEAIARGVADAMQGNNSLLKEQNSILREINRNGGNGGTVTATGVVNGLSQKNRRDGRSVVVLGV